MIRFLDLMVLGMAWLKRKQKVKIGASSPRINIGSSLVVVDDWINIDLSINSLVARRPHWLISLVYRFTGVKQWCSKQRYVDTLANNRFVFHDIRYGLPFSENMVEYIYSSHFLEHLYRPDAEYCLREAFRILKPNGRIRICVPDLEYAFDLYRKGDKETALKFFFP